MGENKKIKILLDSALNQRENFSVQGAAAASFKEKSARPVLFSRGKKSTFFLTENSRLYLNRRALFVKGLLFNFSPKQFDSLNSQSMQCRIAKKKPTFLGTDGFSRKAAAYEVQEDRRWFLNFWQKMAPAQVWNFSLVGAIILGMFSMSLIYQYLGPGAAAEDEEEITQIQEERLLALEKEYPQSKILGAEDEKELVKEGFYFESVLNDLVDKKKDESEQKIREMVKGYPIEAMVPYIAQKDPIVVAFLVGIARKESLWGVHVPLLDGQDCYNYWGYRGIRRFMGTGGHTCFNSQKDAVDTVAKRIEFLVKNKKLDTPAEMVIWKCGSDCEATGGQAAANKWIADVNYYFKKMNES